MIRAGNVGKVYPFLFLVFFFYCDVSFSLNSLGSFAVLLFFFAKISLFSRLFFVWEVPY